MMLRMTGTVPVRVGLPNECMLNEQENHRLHHALPKLLRGRSFQYIFKPHRGSSSGARAPAGHAIERTLKRHLVSVIAVVMREPSDVSQSIPCVDVICMVNRAQPLLHKCLFRVLAELEDGEWSACLLSCLIRLNSRLSDVSDVQLLTSEHLQRPERGRSEK
jgi:hypothetical protein